MKFKEIKLYNAVQFGKEQLTFFTLDESFTKNKPQFSDLSLEEGSWGIRIKSHKDNIIVSYNNVVYAKTVDTKVEEVKPSKAK